MTILKRGEKFTVQCAVAENGDIPAEEFLNTLPPRMLARFAVLFERLAEQGVIRGEERFRALGKGVYEFKAANYRLYCFFCPKGLVIVSHGSIKRKKVQLEREIEKALAFKRAYNC